MTAPTPSRPRSVPREATWVPSDNEWVLGERDAEGRFHGTVRYWRSDGTLCCETQCRHGTLHGDYRRVHENGETSREGTFVEGQLHGSDRFHRSTGETSELFPPGMTATVFSVTLFFEEGEQTYPATYFDANGNETNLLGALKPEHLPDGVRSNAKGEWGLGEEELRDQWAGTSTMWRATGELLSETKVDRNGYWRSQVRYHPDGSAAEEVDYSSKRGRYRKAKGDTDIRRNVFAGRIVRVEFDVDIVDKKSGRFNARNLEFFAADGTSLPSTGRLVTKPRAQGSEVVEVVDGVHRYWRAQSLDGEGRLHGVTKYWHIDASPFLEVAHEEGVLQSLRHFDDDGAVALEERFHPRSDTSGRPLVASLSARTGPGRVEVECDDEGRCVSFQNWTAGTVDTFDGSELSGLDVRGFEREFERRYADLLRTDCVEVYYEFFEIVGLDSERIEAPFRARALTADGGGNNVILIEEGEHAGALFFLDHEEGLHGLDCVDEFIEEEEIEASSMTKDELIAAMPFADTRLADDLETFFRGIGVASSWTYWSKLDDLKPARSEA